MQTLKRDMAGVAAKRGGDWDTHINQVVNAYNERPHSAVFGPPKEVERGDGEQEFRVLQDNAKKFMKNRAQSERRMNNVKETKAIRAPTNAARSFEPSYGPVNRVRKVESDLVTMTNGRQVLLKQAQAVPVDSGRLQGRLTQPELVRRTRMQSEADRVEAYIVENGGEIRTSDLEARMKGRELPGIWLTIRRAKLTLSGFLRTFRNMFKVARGVVTLVNAPGPAPPIPEPISPEPVAPPLTLEERLKAIEARQEERRQQREASNRARLRGLSAAYGGR